MYLRVTLFGKTEYQHRVIWVMHYGEIPEGLEVDHKDRDKTNNRIDNLRLVNSAGNKWNVSAKGYYYCVDRGVYRSRITTKGKTKYLGSFTTEKEAHEAFLDAQKERENH